MQVEDSPLRVCSHCGSVDAGAPVHGLCVVCVYSIDSRAETERA